MRPPEPRSEQEWVEAIHESLRLAVKRRLEIADVPVGVLLSGGLDSSLLVALLAESGVTGLKTFSVGFEDQPEEKGSEFEYSDPVAERYATATIASMCPTPGAHPPARGGGCHGRADGGPGRGGLLPALEQVSKQAVKVVQSGQGADEVFGGYFWYPLMAGETEGSRWRVSASHYFDRTTTSSRA
jgi:asparagine synthase (glutamine-hydrolysing)